MFRRTTQPSRANKDETTLTGNNAGLSQRDSLIESGPSCYDQQLHQSGSSRRHEGFLHKICGFEMCDLMSLDRFLRLTCRPSDPAAIGVIRILFGFLMILDVFEERGLATVDSRFGQDDACMFPLFSFLRPLPLQWMYIVYLLMLTGGFGVMLGLKMAVSSSLYLATYWYVFFLDKTAWNNHSYLFGILAFLFAVTDSNRYGSIDGLLNPKLKNAHIPLWNYTLMRTQIFIVYFIAGLKKLDMDWVSGYSMQSLSQHWIFSPFKLFLTEPQIDLYIVHHGGLILDLSLGFLLFLDKTRKVALILSSTFHIMNSQLFTIGMFPYAMLCTQLFFCDMDWPRKVFRLVSPIRGCATVCGTPCQPSSHCIYSKDYVKPEICNAKYKHTASAPPTSSTWKHTLASMFTVTFVVWQICLPYSHGITKGYNTWTEGLYGYSWDMMVHSWSVHHIRITYRDHATGQSGYLDPEVVFVWLNYEHIIANNCSLLQSWTGGRSRWCSRADMIKQYAHCIADNLKNYNINDVSIYFDIWMSLNYRFQQRLVDPRIDIITAEWHPFKSSSWLMPLMVDLSDWRTQLSGLGASLDNDTYTNVVFLADFPGMSLENYVQPDYGNTTLTVLAGRVLVQLEDQGKTLTLDPGQSVKITADAFHTVHTISELASCYMYVYVNTTEKALMKSYHQFEEDYNRSASLNETLQKYNQDPNLPHYKQMLAAKQTENEEVQQTLWELFQSFLASKYHLFKRSIHLSTGAIYCLTTNNSFHDFLNATYNMDARRQDYVASK